MQCVSSPIRLCEAYSPKCVSSPIRLCEAYSPTRLMRMVFVVPFLRMGMLANWMM